MVLFATLTTIFYLASIITFGLWVFFRYHQKSKKKSEPFLTASLIFIIWFCIAGIMSTVTKDPIPYFEIIFSSGLFAAGILLVIEVPSLIADKVKKELVPEPITYREISLKEARKEIREYLEHKKEDVWMEDVINDLKIDPSVVVRIIGDFHKKGLIKEVN